jgi:hypothetical protein
LKSVEEAFQRAAPDVLQTILQMRSLRSQELARRLKGSGLQ